MRALAIHLHLYQPPRENPWTDAIERQPSAAPYHDWNERISEECYERLGAVPVRRGGRVARLVNLFEHVSFNVGPTLAAWLAAERPEVLEDAVLGDAEALARTGHGNALMQAYGHAIMPLADERERRLHVAWGRADFLARFGREPRGIWLPECAVDRATLRTCAGFGLEFAVVAPEQIAAVRPLEGGDWRDVDGPSAPTDRPLSVDLGDGARFVVVPFHGGLSRGVAFGGLLGAPARLADAARGAVDALPEDGGLALAAADGETLGHHQPGGEAAVAELVAGARDGGPRLASLEHAVAALPPTHEARLREPSAWSCAHGVGRWARDCGCAAEPRAARWSWAWRAPLRTAVTGLWAASASAFERGAEGLLNGPWAAAEGFGEVLARAGDGAALDAWLARHASPSRRDDDTARRDAARLMELVRQALAASTSCGWFFDDLARIEAVQVLRHAARAAELAAAVSGADPEPAFLAALADARSNKPRAGSAAQVWRQRVRTARRGLDDGVGVHAARRLADAARGNGALPPSATRHGAIVVEDAAPPERRERSRGRVGLAGCARAVHGRTLESGARSYRIEAAGVDRPVVLEIDGRRPARPSPPVREALLRAVGAFAAAAADVPPALDWLGRTSRSLGVPSALGALARSAALARLELVLLAAPQDPRRDARALARALRRARSAGLRREDLAAQRGRAGRRLAALAARALDGPDDGAALQLARACRALCTAFGDEALGPLRRTLVRRRGAHHDPRVVRLGEAAGLAPGALAPADTPAAVPGGDGTARA